MKEVTRDLPNVRVEPFDELFVDFACRRMGAQASGEGGCAPSPTPECEFRDDGAQLPADKELETLFIAPDAAAHANSPVSPSCARSPRSAGDVSQFVLSPQRERGSSPALAPSLRTRPRITGRSGRAALWRPLAAAQAALPPGTERPYVSGIRNPANSQKALILSHCGRSGAFVHFGTDRKDTSVWCVTKSGGVVVLARKANPP
ncbi:MAG: hypothetical protein ACLTDR_04955 [Adlercreutzia equolifaciens]